MSQEQNKERDILEAATRLFLQKGFKATSTTEIAVEAGCNQALVHYYFRTKERLFEAIFKKKIQYFIGALLELDEEDISFEQKLIRKIESHFEAIRVNPGVPLFFFSELSSNPKRIGSIKSSIGDLPQRAISKLDSELQVEIAAGRVRPTDIRDLLMTIVSLNITVFLGAPMFKVMTSMTDGDYEGFIEERKQENVRIILNSLKPDQR
jgi:AcrR family transcriptional regulator